MIHIALLTTIASTLIVGVTHAQDLGVPLSWRKFNNSRPLNERISIAQAAVDTILPQLDTSNAQFKGIGYWQSANVFSAMANLDHLAGTTKNKEQVINNLDKAFKLYKNYDQYGCYNDDALWWATAAIYAHRAYNDSNMLSHAVATWNQVSNYVITAADASAGKHPKKNDTIKGTCDKASMAGAVFWRPAADNLGANSITTGLYLTASAYLAEATKEKKYTDAAILSAKWIKAVNLNSNNIVLDSVNAHDCSRSSASWLFTYNSGKYLEGLSVLADVTGDSSWTTLLTTISAAAIKSSAWEGQDGIITEGSSPKSNNDGVGFKAIFIRGLQEVYARSKNNKLRILIHSYNDVQYNALLDLAANKSSYSSKWHGPAQAFTTWGQLAALDVLVTAIDTN